MPDDYRTCRGRCGRILPLESFAWNDTQKRIRKYRCPDCLRQDAAERERRPDVRAKRMAQRSHPEVRARYAKAQRKYAASEKGQAAITAYKTSARGKLATGAVSARRRLKRAQSKGRHKAVTRIQSTLRQYQAELKRYLQAEA
jgi:hypothetical protein